MLLVARECQICIFVHEILVKRMSADSRWFCEDVRGIEDLQELTRAANDVLLNSCCTQHGSVRDFALAFALQSNELTSPTLSFLLQRIFTLQKFESYKIQITLAPYRHLRTPLTYNDEQLSLNAIERLIAQHEDQAW